MNNPSTLRRSPLGMFPGQPTPRLYDRVVEVLRTRHYSRRTEQAYIHWIRRFILSFTPARIRASWPAWDMLQLVMCWNNRWTGSKESCGPANPSGCRPC